MSWPTVPITDVARVVGGATPKSGTQEFWDGEILWTTPKDLTNLGGKFLSDTPRKITTEGLRSCSAEILPVNSVLFSSRAPIGHVAINSVPIATNQGFKSFIPKDRLDASFLYWWLDANRGALQAMGTGATFKEVSKATVERIKIPLPLMEEQKRIAGILDQADALRRLRTRSLEKLNTLGQAIFHEMFGDVVGNSKGFEQQNLTDALNFTTGKLDSNAAVDGGEFPFFTCAKEISAIDKFAFDCEALLLAGNNASADYDVKYYNGKFNAYQRTYVLTLATPELRYRFVQRSLETMLGEMKRFSKGSNTKYLTMEIFRRMNICKPDIELQDLYIERAETLYAEIAKAENAASRYDNLFASLQHRAFRGEL